MYSGEQNDFVKCYVSALKQANIGIGVITNHNKFDKDEYKALRRAAKKEEIFLTSAFATISNPENRNTKCTYDLKNTLEALEAYNRDYFVIFAHVDQGSGLFRECKGGMLESMAGLAPFKKRVLGL